MDEGLVEFVVPGLVRTGIVRTGIVRTVIGRSGLVLTGLVLRGLARRRRDGFGCAGLGSTRADGRTGARPQPRRRLVELRDRALVVPFERGDPTRQAEAHQRVAVRGPHAFAMPRDGEVDLGSGRRKRTRLRADHRHAVPHLRLGERMIPQRLGDARLDRVEERAGHEGRPDLDAVRPDHLGEEGVDHRARTLAVGLDAPHRRGVAVDDPLLDREPDLGRRESGHDARLEVRERKRLALALERTRERVRGVATRLALGGREADRDGGRRRERHRDQADGRTQRPVPRDELPRAVPRVVGHRRDGAPVEPAAQVVGERGDGRIAFGGIAAHRPRGDPLEFARERRRERRPAIERARGGDRVARRIAAHAPGRRFAPSLADRAQHRQSRARRAARVSEGGASGEDLEERRAEAVDIAPDIGVPALAVGLLGTHVGRRPEQLAGLRQVLGGPVAEECLRDAEIDHLRLRPTGVVGRDQDVRGLEIAMDDALAVRVLHGVADPRDERDALAEPEPGAIAPLGDRAPFDELEHEVRAAARRRAAVEDPRDARMLHPRERLALAREARDDRRGVHPGLHELDGDDLLPGFEPDGAPDGAVAAFADDPFEPVGPHHLPGPLDEDSVMVVMHGGRSRARCGGAGVRAMSGSCVKRTAAS